MTGPRNRFPRGGCLGAIGVLVFVSFLLTVILTVAIWPGEMKLTAPLLCPDDKADAYVVVDSVSPTPGETAYNFTLYCMGPRGDVFDAGSLRPVLLLMLGHTVLIVAAVVLILLPAGWHRGRGSGGSG